MEKELANVKETRLPIASIFEKESYLSSSHNSIPKRLKMTKPPIPTYKGRSLGVVALTAAQIFIGAIHVFFGLLLLTFENLSFLQSTIIYDIYTIVFGVLTVVFAVFIWQGKKAGWVGTIAVSLFVIVADSLTLLDLPSIPGIPKFAGFGEITYSILIIIYLCTRQARAKYWVRLS